MIQIRYSAKLTRTAGAIMATVMAVLLTTTVTDIVNAQDRAGDSPRVSPNAAVSQTIGTTVVDVTYGRPGVRDREIFAPDGLVSFGDVWRTGADESTAITFSNPVQIEGEQVEAGTYSLYTIPDQNEWTIILNHTLSWGTRYDESEDLIRVQVQPEQAPQMEQFLIYFDRIDEESARLNLHWDEIRVPVRIDVVE